MLARLRHVGFVIGAIVGACTSAIPQPTPIAVTPTIPRSNLSATVTLLPTSTATQRPPLATSTAMTTVPELVIPTVAASPLPPLSQLLPITKANIQQLKPLTVLVSTEPEALHSLAFSTDEQLLAVGQNSVTIWDLAMMQAIHTFAIQGDNLQFSPDGISLVCSGPSETVLYSVIIMDLNSGQITRTLDGYGDVIADLTFSPDGSVLAETRFFSPGLLQLWNTSHWTLISEEGSTSGEYEVAFSPDGRTLISASREGYVLQWNPHDGQFVRQIQGCRQGQVTDVAFSPDGHYLATVCYDSLGSGFGFDNAIRLYDVNTWQLLRTVGDNNLAKSDVVFSPDSKMVISKVESSDNDLAFVEFWDIESGALLHTVTAWPADSIFRLSPNGRLLAIGMDSAIGLFGVAPP